MQVWLECCLHGEVQRIAILRDFAAVRFASVISAAAAVDALDGRFFAERTPNPNPDPDPNPNPNPNPNPT